MNVYQDINFHLKGSLGQRTLPHLVHPAEITMAIFEIGLSKLSDVASVATLLEH